VGEGVTEAELVKWSVEVGEVIEPDQVVCEVMTDKATMEINCPVGGTVMEVCGEEGDILPVHAALLKLSQDGSAPAPKPEPQSTVAPAIKATPEPKSTPTPKPALAPISTPNPSGKVLASPAVRVFAKEQGTNLQGISGTGKGGRITRDDVRSQASAPVHTSQIKAPPAIQVQASRADQVIKIVGLRRKIAEKMLESVQRAPHFTYVDEIDMTDLVNMRGQLKGLAAEYGVKLTYIPFIMKALVQAFQEFPTVNAVINEADLSMVVRGEVNIGIACDTPQGLYVPVIKNVEQKSILELAAEITDITTRTREGKVQLSELQGGTFTITSVGNIGGRFATPIINHPEVAILGVNQIHDRPMVINGEIVARKMMYLSPSFDHRVIDGAVAARFISALKSILENPASLLLSLR
jgi:pyruvate dehydrogenase E2 component (dihydrolipoamide acetyltransferase)